MLNIRKECSVIYQKLAKIYEGSQPSKFVNGNFNFMESLMKSEKFKEGLDIYKTSIQDNQGKEPGRNVQNYAIRYILEDLLPFLASENGVSSELISRQNLEGWLMSDEYRVPVYAFSKDSYHWINMLSSLHLRVDFFSTTSDEELDFDGFLKNYSDFLGGLDNRKTVPWYSRSLPDIAAAITIYKHKTDEYYRNLLTRFEETLENAIESSGNDVYGKTQDVQDAVVKIVQNDELEANRICMYISNNPKKFEVKRYAQIIESALTYLINMGCLAESERHDFYKIEKPIIKLRFLFEKVLGREFQIKGTYNSKYSKDYELVFEGNSKEDNEQLITLLRALIIISEIVNGADSDIENVIDNINAELRECGIKRLDTTNSKMCTKGNVFDWCVYKLLLSTESV